MFRRLQYTIQKYFGLSRGEANGGIVFMILMLGVLFLPYAWEQWIFNPKPQFTGTRQQGFADSLEALKKVPATTKITLPDTANLTPFRPDTLTFVQWKQLGVPDKIARRTIKYLKKGGTFAIKSDLLKIYDFPENVYKHIRNYIALPGKLRTNHQPNKKSSGNKISTVANKKAAEPFDLNKANPGTLQTIKGIGKIYSERIVKFRELLGGFATKEQLFEVYGMDSTLVENLLKRVYISPGYRPQTLDVNGAEFSTLLRHPYINYETTKLLVNNRPFAGPEEVEELVKENGTNWIGLKPYLHVSKDYNPTAAERQASDSARDGTD